MKVSYSKKRKRAKNSKQAEKENNKKQINKIEKGGNNQ